MVENIKLENISKKFEGKEILKGINLEIRKGENFGIFGGSGCGKTTILRIIAGLERPESGNIYLRGKKVTSDNIFIQPEDRNVSFIFQDLALWPHMTVKEHLKFVLNDSNKIDEILDACGLSNHKKSKPSELSGGEKQRLAIARAIAQKSDIFLLDEPLSSLDLSIKEEIKKLLKKLQREYKLTLVYVTHDIFEIVDICDKIAMIKDGKISNIGDPVKLLKDQLKIIDKSRKKF